jgi:hypothetical protein
MHPMQAYVDGINQQMQRARAETQMTLGKLISALRAMPPDTQVANLCHPHSYRGYYCDLAFVLGNRTRRAAELLAECEAAMGEVFTGYKGGEFVMGTLTPVWVASCGCCGERLIALHSDGTLEAAADE